MPAVFVRSDLTLESATFEIRYPKSFSLWDAAGRIANEIRKKWPDIVSTDAQPARIQFRLDRSYSFSVELEKTYVGVQLPNPNLKDFSAIAETVNTIVQRALDISEFQRVGLRMVHNKEFDSLALATEQFMRLGKVIVPSEKFFGQEGAPNSGEYKMRWENEKTGVLVQLRTETARMEFDPPVIFRDISPVNKNVHRFVYDLDYYTVAKVSAAQLKVTDWIESILHLANRDSKNFLEV